MYSVIIVDDEKHCIIDLEKSISWETYGYKIVNTYSIPEEAEAGILAFSPDVVFVDIKMPRITGLQLIANVKKMGYKGEFVIVSGYDDFEYAKSALKQKIFDYCLKPIDEEEIVNTLVKLGQQLGDTKEEAMSECSDVIKEKSAGATMMNQIIDYINLNIHKKLSIGDVCDNFSISNTYCTRLFKKYLDQSFTKFLTERRMECAKKLLEETDFSIQEISFKVGMDDYYYFTKKFKGHTQMTPTEYRKSRVMNQ